VCITLGHAEKKSTCKLVINIRERLKIIMEIAQTVICIQLTMETQVNKVKIKLSLCLTKHHTMKANWERRDTAPQIL